MTNMNDFSFAAFLSYLLIAVLGGAAAAVLAATVLRQARRSFWKILFVAAAGIAAIFGYFNIHKSKLVSQLDQNSPVSPPLQKPTSTISPLDPEPISTPREARTAQTKESAEDAFMREVISAPRPSKRIAGQWAVVIAGPDSGENYPQIGNAVSDMISSKGGSIVAVFRPSVLRQVNFENLFAADPALDRKLGQYCDYLFVGKVASSTTQDSNLADVISVNLILNVRIISTKIGGISSQFKMQAVGAGVKLDEARTNAEERLANEIRSQFRDLLRQQ